MNFLLNHCVFFFTRHIIWIYPQSPGHLQKKQGQTSQSHRDYFISSYAIPSFFQDAIMNQFKVSEISCRFLGFLWFSGGFPHFFPKEKPKNRGKCLDVSLVPFGGQCLNGSRESSRRSVPWVDGTSTWRMGSQWMYIVRIPPPFIRIPS